MANPSKTRPNQRIAIVTGATSGIGRVTAFTLAREGYRVIATWRSEQRRDALAAAAAQAGLAECFDLQPCDVTCSEDIQRLAEHVQQAYGRLDALVNNAGFALGGFAEDVSDAELRRQMETNFFAHVAVTRAMLPIFRQQQAGHIVMISSVLGRTGNPGVSAYCASKFALEGWTETLRMELRSLGIRVALVEPGAFDSDIWERNVQVAEVARTGASPNASRARRFTEKTRGGTKKADPQVVADRVLRILQHPDPSLRHIVGKDATTAMIARKLLSYNTYERFAIRNSKIDG